MTFRLEEPGTEVASTMGRWLREYIGSPHPDLGRDGPVCPFVLPALKAGGLKVLEHRWSGGYDPARMAALIHTLVDRFHERPDGPVRSELNALAVVVTGLPRTRWPLIDAGHRRAKHEVVARGYMVGQFHPECREPAVHNPFFAVNTAPYPLLAVRRMAVHDILFLHQDPLWFEEYRKLFGHRFAGAGRVNEHLRALYERTCRRYRRIEPGARPELEPSWKSS
ncbi:DUF6875 domain-containing protein [Nocardia goodfellowii]